jgi:peptidoglycan-N-acetylglucosamine deacetylase
MLTRFATLALSLVLIAVLPLPALPGEGQKAASSATNPLSLWTAAQLAESQNPAKARAERAIRHLQPPDLTPPARTAPASALPTLPEARQGIIRRVVLPAGDRRVALTFDLCERTVHVTGYDARLVDALREANAKATFFAGGKWLRSHPERALQLMADGRFELGNHSWTHANMAVAPAAFRKQQLEWTSAQYDLLRGELERRYAARGLSCAAPGPLKLFRLPYGRGGAEVAQYLNGQGYAVIQWDVVGEGGAGSIPVRARAIAEAIQPGSIVLLHANAVPKDTAALVRCLLPLLAAKGYATATVSELLAAGRPEAVEDGYFTSPGDNAIYDEMFAGYGTGGRVKTAIRTR